MSSPMRNWVALLLSPMRRQTKPGLRSARALTRSRLSMNSAMRGSLVGYLNLPTLSSARCMASLLRRLEAHRAFVIGIGRILIDALLDDMAEMANEPLDWPSRRIAERADC